MKKSITALFLFLLSYCYSFAQNEYLVKVDLATGHWTKVKKIDSVCWVMVGNVAYDQLRSRLTFIGHQDMSNMSSKNYNLYTVSTKDGSLLSKASYHYDPAPSFIVYSSFNDTIYGLRWDTTIKREFLVCINPATGTYYDLTVIPGLKGLNLEQRTLDPVHKIFYVAGIDSLGGRYLFRINLATYMPMTPLSLASGTSNFNYDSSVDLLYCTAAGAVPPTVDAGMINASTGNLVNINTITGLNGFGYARGYDDVHHYHMIKGLDATSQWHLYTINATNGQVVYSPLHPTPNGGSNIANDNLIYPVYNKDSNAVYALLWEANTPPDTTNAVKNIEGVGQNSCLTIPSVFTPNNDGDNDRFEIKSPCPVTGFKMQVYNLAGQHVYETNNINDNWDGTVSGSPAPTGIYCYTVEFKSVAGKNEYRKGRVTLVR